MTDNNFAVGFGKRLQRARRACKPKLSQKEVGRRLGVGANQVARWERGANLPRLTQISLLAKAVGTTEAFLLTGAAPARVSARAGAVEPSLDLSKTERAALCKAMALLQAQQAVRPAERCATLNDALQSICGELVGVAESLNAMAARLAACRAE